MSCYKIDNQKAQKTNKNAIKQLSKKALQEKVQLQNIKSIFVANYNCALSRNLKMGTVKSSHFYLTIIKILKI